MGKSFIIAFFLLVSFSVLNAQSAIQAIETGQNVNVLFRNEATGGIFAHSRGFGLEYKRLKHVTGKNKRFFELQALNMRHPKEYKVQFEGKGGNKGFYYGKLNSVFSLRSGFGMQKSIYERAERKSIEIRCSYSIGPTLALAKPVYLYVYKENIADPVIEAYDPDLHNLNNIAGRAPFLYGFNKLKVHPGAYAKLGFSFEYADYSNEVRAIETGVVADIYPLGVPIMANNKKEQIFVTLYIGFVFGKKWF